MKGGKPLARHDYQNPIQHYLGHKNIQHTVRYTELAASCFQEFWSD
jgi:type 1 fimbriae regulatory protein FimB/type 1 fimbriae regulatory protein FimE